MAAIMTKRGSMDNIVTFEHICDTMADMASIERAYTTLGSVCIVLQGEGGGLEVYMANSRGQWEALVDSAAGASAEASLSLHICSQAEVSNGLPNIASPDEKTIYLVPAASATTGNLYDEYIYVDDHWEKFGSGGGSSIDLNNYLQTTDIAAWAKAAEKPTYTAQEVGALPSNTVIPTIPSNISAFQNDAGYLTQHQDISAKANSADLATVATTGDYTDLLNKPTIPDISTMTMAQFNTIWNKYFISVASVLTDNNEPLTTDSGESLEFDQPT